MKKDNELILNAIKLHYGYKKDTHFADFLGIKPQTLSTWRARNMFDYELLYKKCKGISGDYLLTGHGDMFKSASDSDSRPIIELNPSAKANTFVSDLKAAAGFGALINNPKKIEQLPAISLPNAPMGLNVAFQITGDSMHPAVRHLDYVAGNHVRDIKDIRNGYTYILIDRDDGVLYKRLYIEGNGGSVLKIVSDNPDYPPYTREPDSIIAYFKAFCRLSSDFRPYYDDIRREIQQLKEDVAWMKGRIK